MSCRRLRRENTGIIWAFNLKVAYSILCILLGHCNCYLSSQFQHIRMSKRLKFDFSNNALLPAYRPLPYTVLANHRSDDISPFLGKNVSLPSNSSNSSNTSLNSSNFISSNSAPELKNSDDVLKDELFSKTYQNNTQHLPLNSSNQKDFVSKTQYTSPSSSESISSSSSALPSLPVTVQNWVDSSQKSIYTKPSTFAESGNPYLDRMARVSPNELLSFFMEHSPPRVQEAARLTIMGLLGTLPRYALETTVLTTGEKLASLLFQLQMSGYMLKNAEYRVTLMESLSHVSKGVTAPDAVKIVTDHSNVKGFDKSGNVQLYNENAENSINPSSTHEEFLQEKLPVSGTIHLHLMDGQVIDVDAAVYVSKLQDQLRALRSDRQNASRDPENGSTTDLLLYIKSLPSVYMRTLTENISEPVLEAMKNLTHAVVEGLGGYRGVGVESITQQTGTALAQLCMWQLAVGYNLRELEVRNEIQNALNTSKNTN